MMNSATVPGWTKCVVPSVIPPRSTCSAPYISQLMAWKGQALQMTAHNFRSIYKENDARLASIPLMEEVTGLDLQETRDLMKNGPVHMDFDTPTPVMVWIRGQADRYPDAIAQERDLGDALGFSWLLIPVVSVHESTSLASRTV